MYIFVPQVWRTFYTKLKNDQLAPKLENAHLLGTVPSGYHVVSTECQLSIPGTEADGTGPLEGTWSHTPLVVHILVPVCCVKSYDRLTEEFHAYRIIKH